jgi:hypothetical protein
MNECRYGCDFEHHINYHSDRGTFWFKNPVETLVQASYDISKPNWIKLGISENISDCICNCDSCENCIKRQY